MNTNIEKLKQIWIEKKKIAIAAADAAADAHAAYAHAAYAAVDAAAIEENKEN